MVELLRDFGNFRGQSLDRGSRSLGVCLSLPFPHPFLHTLNYPLSCILRAIKFCFPMYPEAMKPRIID